MKTPLLALTVLLAVAAAAADDNLIINPRNIESATDAVGKGSAGFQPVPAGILASRCEAR